MGDPLAAPQVAMQPAKTGRQWPGVMSTGMSRPFIDNDNCPSTPPRLLLKFNKRQQHGTFLHSAECWREERYDLELGHLYFTLQIIHEP